MILSELEAKLRYQDYLRKVEHERLIKQFKKSRPFSRVVQSVGKLLISAGQHLAGNKQPEHAHSVACR